MIEERRQDIRKHLEDPDDEDAHNHPLPYLLRQRRFHDLPEEEAERQRIAQEKKENSFWNKTFKKLKKFGQDMITEEE